MNGIKSFSIYDTYYKLMKLLPEQQRGLLYSKILEYVFEDIEPTDLTEEQESIWVNLKRPIDTSKAQAKNVLKRWNKDTEEDTNIDTDDDTNEDTKADTQSKMSMSMSNVNVNVNKYSYEINSIIQHLNEVAGTKYKASTKTTRTKIIARLNEGYKLNDFIVVIDKKYNEWKNTEMEKYMRPETLFGSKFENYLNQPARKRTYTTRDVQNYMDFSDF